MKNVYKKLMHSKCGGGPGGLHCKCRRCNDYIKKDKSLLNRMLRRTQKMDLKKAA